jgi:hypothetical protein
VTSARRTLLLLVLLALGGGLAAFLALRPLGLLEESAGPLDGLLPSDVDVAARFDPDGLVWSPAARTLWEHPRLAEMRAATGLDAEVLEPLRALEDRVGRASLGLAPSVDRDVLGLEAVVARRGADLLLLTRLTGRGKLLDAAARMDSEALRAAGLRVQGDVATLEREGAPEVHLRRVRDVLAVSTSREMLATVAALGEPPEGTVRGTSPYADALRGREAPGARVFVWAAPSALFRGEPPDPGALGVEGLLAAIFAPEGLGVTTSAVDLGDPERVHAAVHGGWTEPLPGALGAFVDDVPGGVDGLHVEAERLAVPGEAFATLGVAVGASEAVRALAAAQPPARRELLDEILAERGLSVDEVAARVAAHLHDGMAAVVSRLPEADDLELDDPRSGGVHPIPATVVAFRLRRPGEPQAVIDELAREAESLFGSALHRASEPGPGGARVHRLEKHRFGGEWALLRPAVAVVDGLLVFATHDAHLLRTLAQRERGDVAVSPQPARTLSLRVAGEPFHRHVEDQRWAWADRETRHDWRAERAAIRRELDESGSILSPADRQVYENERIEMRLRRRNETEFPAAIERFRASWAHLEVLDGLRLRIDRDGAAFELDLDVRLRRVDRR